MLSNLGTGPVLDSVGLFHVISSYCGEFSISITSCRELMPDPDFYRQCLQESFDELLASTVGSKPAPRPPQGGCQTEVSRQKVSCEKRQDKDSGETENCGE